jgi:hypothetical protein
MSGLCHDGSPFDFVGIERRLPDRLSVCGLAGVIRQADALGTRGLAQHQR